MVGTVLCCQWSARAETLTYVDLVKRLTSLERLATLPEPGEGCAQWSSYDRNSKYDETTGKYVDWAANGDGGGIIRKEGEQLVFAEMEGPGCIWRTWSARPQEGHVRIFLDGAETPAVAIIKHANPCGVAQGASIIEAYRAALACDSTSAFGGIVALNRPLDEETAAEISQIFTEVVIAPGANAAAEAIFARKKNLRLLITEGLPDPAAAGRFIKTVAGGFLMQDRDFGRITRADLKVVTKIAPTEQQLDDLLFAWRVAKHVKSNTIVYAKDGATVGVGAGQMSRIDSARIAARKAEDAAEVAGWAEPKTKGCVAASDAFFPFPDGLLQAASAGASAVIQPGGSIRDDEVIAAADEAGLAMVFTGMRHFRH